MDQQVPGAGLPFKLLRWFSVAGFVLVAAFAAANALLLSSFLNKHLLQREAQITADFVRNILLTDGTVEFLANPGDPELRARFLESTKHFTSTREILRTNVYARDGTVLWSTDKSLVGKKFEHNEELEDALKGLLAVESGGISSDVRKKPEHVGLPADSRYFIETYIPIMRAGASEVIGVVETYKAQVALTEAIHAGYRQVWLTAGIGALALYLTLFWIVRRADQTIRQQHARLIETETMAAAGELTSSMAHNIRNPLATIRSSAELSIELRGEDNQQQARDIIGAVDRIEGWIRELLRYTRADAHAHAPVDLGAVLSAAFKDQAREFERHAIRGSVRSAAPGALVSGDTPVLAQVLHSVISNAIDATPCGGQVDGRIERIDSKWIAISITDTGHGIAPEHMDAIFRPFYTTKKEGLGLGLSLVRRSIERMGGRIRVESTPDAGTVVTLELPTA